MGSFIHMPPKPASMWFVLFHRAHPQHASMPLILYALGGRIACAASHSKSMSLNLPFDQRHSTSSCASKECFSQLRVAAAQPHAPREEPLGAASLARPSPLRFQQTPTRSRRACSYARRPPKRHRTQSDAVDRTKQAWRPLVALRFSMQSPRRPRAPAALRTRRR